jgi:hypothetical protein
MSKFDQLVISLFGLEIDLWDSCAQLEKSKFKNIAILFCVLSCFGFLGLIYLFYLLQDNLLISIVGGFIFGIVLLNIFQFSVFTLQKPINKKLFLENNNNKAITETNNATVPVSIENIPIINKRKIWYERLEKLEYKVSKLITFLLRMLINGILVLVIAVSFTCLINCFTINQLNNTHRANLLSTLTKEKNDLYKANCNKYRAQLNQKADLFKKYNSSYYYNEYQKEQAKLNPLIEEENIKRDNEIYQLHNQLKNKRFVILSVMHVLKLNSFYIVLSLLAAIVLCIHILKFKLISNPEQNGYYTQVNKRYYNLILNNYTNSLNSIKNILDAKYSSVDTDCAKYLFTQTVKKQFETYLTTTAYTDPPFNSETKHIKYIRKKMSLSEFINHHG